MDTTPIDRTWVAIGILILLDAGRSHGGRLPGIISSGVLALIPAIAEAQIGERVQRNRI